MEADADAGCGTEGSPQEAPPEPPCREEPITAVAASEVPTGAAPVDASAVAEESCDPPPEAERKKGLGNAAFQAKQYDAAIQLYGEAIAEAGDRAPAVYFSNRAVCYAAKCDWQRSREDAAMALSRPGGATKKTLYQKARAELRLHLNADADATLQLAALQGLQADIARLLAEDGLRVAQPPASNAAKKRPAPSSNASNGSSPEAAADGSPGAAGVNGLHRAPAAAPAEAADAAAAAKEAGNKRYKEGAYKEALAEYERALALLPGDDRQRRAAFLGNAAAACLMLRRVDACRAMCEESLALDSTNVKIRARLATAQVASGDFATARSTLVEGGGPAADPSLANAARQFDEWEVAQASADAAAAAGEPAKALSLYADLESKALFQCTALTLKMGRCYMELNNFPRTLNATQQVLRASPQNVEALCLRAEALYRNNTVLVESTQWTEALEQGQKLLKSALSYDPDHADARGLLKRFRLLCGKHAEVKQAFDSREFERAQELLDEMIQNSQDNPVLLGGLYSERAKADMRLKDWRAVLKDVGQATYRNHSLVQPYLLRAQALQNLDRHEDAVKELEGLFAWHRDQTVHDKLQEAKFIVKKKNRPNFYELLSVPSIASALEIKRAYREKATEWHPDKKGHLDDVARKNAEEMFKRIGEAYEVLTDPVKKDLYDKGYDLEGIHEQIELSKRQAEHGHGGHGHYHGGHGHCC